MNVDAIVAGFENNLEDMAYCYALEKTGLYAPTPSETELYAHWAMNMPELLQEFEDAMDEYNSFRNN